jgi:hypothetical protein
MGGCAIVVHGAVTHRHIRARHLANALELVYGLLQHQDTLAGLTQHPRLGELAANIQVGLRGMASNIIIIIIFTLPAQSQALNAAS